MKKIKNKFILVTIFIIVLIVLSQVIFAYSQNNTDTQSYLTLIKGNATLNESRLDKETEYVLQSGDKIRVIGESSLAVIEWGDGSLTRLGGNTKISIEQNEISRDYTKINISFDLIAGKTWSNVVSFIGKDSSFTQTFDDMEAGVRGTIFDVDLEKEFIHVSDHLVELKDNAGKIYTLEEGKIFSLHNFSFIELSEFIASLEDAAWTNINQQFDSQYIQELQKELDESLDSYNPFLFILEWIFPKYRVLYELDTAEKYEEVSEKIADINSSKYPAIYQEVLSKYQSMNFVQASDYEAYKRKVFYKKALLELSDNQGDTQRLLQSSVYDLQDIAESQSTQGLKETLSILGEHTDQLGDIDMSFLLGGLEYIPDGLKEEFQSNFESLGELFEGKGELLKNINQESIEGVLDNVDNAIQDFLDKNAGEFLQNIAQ